MAQLDHAGHPHEIDARLEVETADDGRSRDDQDLQLRKRLGQRVRDGAATADVAQPETVVAVDEDAAVRRRNG